MHSVTLKQYISVETNSKKLDCQKIQAEYRNFEHLETLAKATAAELDILCLTKDVRNDTRLNDGITNVLPTSAVLKADSRVAIYYE